MAGKTFIVSSQGFYAGSEFDVPSRTSIHKWTRKLSEAFPVKGSRAKDIITKYGFDAFIWSPFADTPTPVKFEVKLITDYDYGNPHTQYWSPIRNYEKKNDFTYLRDLGVSKPELYTYEEATTIANNKNTGEITYIKGKINEIIKNTEYYKNLKERKNGRIDKIS